MSNKVFIGVIVAISVGLVGFAIVDNRKTPEQPRPGVVQADKGQKHVGEGEVKYNGSEPPTSGPHSSPYPWEYYDRLVYSYNVPDFTSEPVKLERRKVERGIVSRKRVPVKVR